MKFSLTIDMDNAAFADDLPLASWELERITTHVLKVVRGAPRFPADGTLRDSNGNRVGSWEITA